MRARVEGGVPNADTGAFRRALGSFPTGVTIITASGPDGPVGVTANSFSSVSLDPPLILWSISHASRSYRAFLDSKHFAINILADNQIGVSQRFSSSIDDKFGLVSWREGKTGSPLIDDALAYFDCICEATYEGGDHTIMVGRVVDFARYEGAPLAFFQGRYGVMVDHPEITTKTSVLRSKDTIDTNLADLPLFSLIAKAHYKEDIDVNERRAAVGITPIGSKVLGGLYNSVPQTAEELSNKMYIDRREVDDSLNYFILQGEIVKLQDGRYELTESGRKRRQLVIDYLEKYQEEQLANISDADIAITRRVLEEFLTPSEK